MNSNKVFMKKIIFFIFLLIVNKSYSQTKYSFSEIERREFRNSIRLNYILVHQPTNQVNYTLKPRMGFVGLNYNIPLNDWLYTGAGFHTAITGDQGGLFTLGVNLGVNTPIYKNLFF